MELFQGLLNGLEDYYMQRIFHIREQDGVRDAVRLNELVSIYENAMAYGLSIPAKMAENSIKIIRERWKESGAGKPSKGRTKPGED